MWPRAITSTVKVRAIASSTGIMTFWPHKTRKEKKRQKRKEGRERGPSKFLGPNSSRNPACYGILRQIYKADPIELQLNKQSFSKLICPLSTTRHSLQMNSFEKCRKQKTTQWVLQKVGLAFKKKGEEKQRLTRNYGWEKSNIPFEKVRTRLQRN